MEGINRAPWKGKFTFNGETWSLGTILKHIISGDVEWTHNKYLLYKHNYGQDVMELLDWMIDPDPKTRPFMHTVVERLEYMND
jgi:hypothetical protein